MMYKRDVIPRTGQPCFIENSSKRLFILQVRILPNNAGLASPTIIIDGFSSCLHCRDKVVCKRLRVLLRQWQHINILETFAMIFRLIIVSHEPYKTMSKRFTALVFIKVRKATSWTLLIEINQGKFDVVIEKSCARTALRSESWVTFNELRCLSKGTWVAVVRSKHQWLFGWILEFWASLRYTSLVSELVLSRYDMTRGNLYWIDR